MSGCQGAGRPPATYRILPIYRRVLDRWRLRRIDPTSLSEPNAGTAEGMRAITSMKGMISVRFPPNPYGQSQRIGGNSTLQHGIPHGTALGY